MKKVFSGEVYEVLPISNGIIFSYCKDIIEENTLVSYKMITFDNGRFTDIAKNIYLLTKFGNNYKAVAALCGNYITAKSIVLPGSKVFLLSEDGEAKLLGADAVPVWTGELKYRGAAATDIALYKNALWASFADCNVLLRYNLTAMREELRIGGNKSPFNKPSGLFIDGDTVMVSNTGSSKLIEVNLNTYSVFEYEEFSEPVRQYVRVGDNRFAVLDSGLYLI
ncbi:MAG: hypothetical protein ACI4F7_12550 [Acutalibacteraceae bacterium]